MTWWHRLWRREQMEAQLEKEMCFHLEQHTADLIARGQNPVEALRQARLALGGPEQVKEACRDARGTRWLEDLWQDFRYAVRTLRQRPGFAAVAILTLALGSGATSVMFTVIHGVLLKPLPYFQPDRLVAVHGRTASWNVGLYGQQNLAYLDFLDCQRDSRSLELAGWVYNSGTMSEPGDAEHVIEFQASFNFFSVLGVPLYRGRAFLPEEDQAGGRPVAILGYSLWRRRFAGSLAALSAAMVLDGRRYTVVGIASPGFRVDGEEADVYTPVGQNTLGYMRNRGPHPVGGIGRLRPGATLEQSEAELALIGRHLAVQFPDTNRGRTFVAEVLRPDVGDVRSTLWLLLGAADRVRQRSQPSAGPRRFPGPGTRHASGTGRWPGPPGAAVSDGKRGAGACRRRSWSPPGGPRYPAFCGVLARRLAARRRNRARLACAAVRAWRIAGQRPPLRTGAGAARSGPQTGTRAPRRRTNRCRKLAAAA
jgi:hypothetical protein